MTAPHTPLLNSLIASGTCVFWVDYRTGVINSIVGNHPGAITSTVKLSRKGASVTAVSGTIYIDYSTFTPPNEMTILVITKKGSTGDYYINNGKLAFFNGSTNTVRIQSNGSTTAVSANNAFLVGERKYIAATRTNADPSLANIYVNGVLSGAANQSTGTITAGTVNMRVAQSLGDTEVVIIFNQIISLANQNILFAELDSITYNINPGGRVLSNGSLLYDYEGGPGILQSVAAEGGATGQWISNTGFQCYDTTGRFQVVREAAGPGGVLGKSIKATAATTRKIYRGGIPGNTGSWVYWWYDASASTWKTQTSAIHGGTTNVEFSFDQNDRLFIAQDFGDTYNIRHSI